MSTINIPVTNNDYTESIYKKYHAFNEQTNSYFLIFRNDLLAADVSKCGKKYVTEMLDAGIRELSERKACWLLGSMFKNQKSHIWDFAALSCIFSFIFTEKSYEDLMKIINKSVPFTNYSWEESAKLIIFPDNASLSEFSKYLQTIKDSTPEEMLEIKDRYTAARAAASRGKTDVSEEREKIINEALAEAAQIKQDAMAEKERILREAAEIRQKAEEERQKAADEADHQKSLIRDAYIVEKTNPAAAEEYMEIRKEIAKEVNSMQNDTRELIQESVRTLTKELENFDSRMTSINRSCREMLYSADFRLLAGFYSDFYRYVNSALDAEIEKTDVGDPADGKLKEQIEQHQARLVRFLKSLERAMSKLGLDFFRPQAGELSDDIYHIEADAEMTQSGLPIVRCVSPGIKVSGENGPVLIPAEVELDHTQSIADDETNETESCEGEQL